MTGPIRVAVNLLWCDPGRVGGSEEYLARQWGGVLAVDADGTRVRPTIYASRGWTDAHADLAARYPTRSPRIPVSARPLRIAAEHTWLAAHTRGADLVHHGGGTVPAAGARPVVLTIHDLQFLHHPEYFSAAKLRYLRHAVPASVRRAAIIATPSAWVRSTVIEAYGVADETVMVVPHGVPAATTVGADRLDEVRDRYGLDGTRWLAYPAITHPHKRHDLLVEMMAHLDDHDDLVLVLLGGPGAAEESVVARILELGLTDRVLRPGRVPDVDRDAIVAGAEALVFPSRYEGFGAPLLEAMALGTPVVCSDHPAVAEVVDDAAIVAEDDPAAWAEAVERVLEDRSGLIARGRARAASFTDAASAAALLEACERAVGR